MTSAERAKTSSKTELKKTSDRTSARPDPETGEVPAGPGDAGLQAHPVVNAGSPGTKQMSNRRLGIGLAIAAGLAVLTILLTALL